MGFRVEKLHNGSDELPPTICISVADRGWKRAYKRWREGKLPTDNNEWKFGITAEISKTLYHIVVWKQKNIILSTFSKRGDAVDALCAYAFSHHNQTLYILELTEYELSKKLDSGKMCYHKIHTIDGDIPEEKIEIHPISNYRLFSLRRDIYLDRDSVTVTYE